MAGENRRINTLSVIAHAQSELVIVIADFNFYLLCLRVLEGGVERFGSNFVNLVTEDGMEVSRLTLNRYTESCGAMIA